MHGYNSNHGIYISISSHSIISFEQYLRLISEGHVVLNFIWFPPVAVENLSKKDLTIQKNGGPGDNMAPIIPVNSSLILPLSQTGGRNKEHSGSTLPTWHCTGWSVCLSMFTLPNDNLHFLLALLGLALLINEDSFAIRHPLGPYSPAMQERKGRDAAYR